MFLLRAKNTYGDKKQQQAPQVKRFNCLYIASVELFVDIGNDQSAMKKTVDRTVGNLNLKTVSGEPVQIVLNESGIIVQEYKYKDQLANAVLMAHALKRICFTTSFPKKRLYMFVARLPQEERVFAHFFLMQDKSSGDKIIKELSKAFTNAFKTKKRRTLERDQRRNLRSQHQMAPQQAQAQIHPQIHPQAKPQEKPQIHPHAKPQAKPQPPAEPPRAPASPKKRKEKHEPVSEFHPPPPYADILSNEDQIIQQYNMTSPIKPPSAPPLYPDPIPSYAPQPLPFDLPQQAPPLYRHDPFAPQPETPAYLQGPFAPNPGNLSPVCFQLDPFSQLLPQLPRHSPESFLEASDGLPSYNSYSKPAFLVLKDELLIDLGSPDHIATPTTKLTRSLSTSNVLDEVRGSTPEPPLYGTPEPTVPPSRQEAALPAFRPRVSNETGSRPKSGLYPSLSSGLARGTDILLPVDDIGINTNGFSHQEHEHYELANEPWYQQGLPRDIIIEILQSQKEGAFFIRESLSQPGKLALSVRCSASVQHYLIIQSRKGYHIENDKIFFPSISLLVMHHSINRGVLQCTLAVGDSNPSYLRSDNLESSDSEAEGEDPIYTLHALTGSMNLHQH